MPSTPKITRAEQPSGTAALQSPLSDLRTANSCLSNNLPDALFATLRLLSGFPSPTPVFQRGVGICTLSLSTRIDMLLDTFDRHELAERELLQEFFPRSPALRRAVAAPAGSLSGVERALAGVTVGS